MTNRKLMPRHQPQLILFDLDNTLCDHRTSLHIRLDYAFRDAAPDAEQRERLVNQSAAIATDGTGHFRELLAREGIESPEALENALERYRSDRFRGLELFDDVLDGIRAVRSRYEVGIITNGPTDIQQPKLDLLEIESLFSFVLISESTGFWKPDPRIFELALQRAGVPPHEAVYVGDSPGHDVAGARAAGISAVWMNRFGDAWPGGAEPDLEAANLQALIDWLGI